MCNHQQTIKRFSVKKRSQPGGLPCIFSSQQSRRDQHNTHCTSEYIRNRLHGLGRPCLGGPHGVQSPWPLVRRSPAGAVRRDVLHCDGSTDARAASPREVNIRTLGSGMRDPRCAVHRVCIGCVRRVAQHHLRSSNTRLPARQPASPPKSTGCPAQSSPSTFPSATRPRSPAVSDSLSGSARLPKRGPCKKTQACHLAILDTQQTGIYGRHVAALLLWWRSRTTYLGGTRNIPGRFWDVPCRPLWRRVLPGAVDVCAHHGEHISYMPCKKLICTAAGPGGRGGAVAAIRRAHEMPDWAVNLVAAGVLNTYRKAIIAVRIVAASATRLDKRRLARLSPAAILASNSSASDDRTRYRL
jgi:hypothetical protein